MPSWLAKRLLPGNVAAVQAQRTGSQSWRSARLRSHVDARANNHRTTQPPPSTVAQQIAGAAARLRDVAAGATPLRSALRPPRPEQVGVLADLGRYLAAVHSGDGVSNYARIVLPPRTGKTVIAGHILAQSGLPAVFVVPTRVLVEQTRHELRLVHPELVVGTFYGEARELAPGGITITTYTMLDRLEGFGDHSSVFRNAGLVFLDEAHHCMTRERLRWIRELFADDAIRIALTATPDHDERRTLCRFFPDLIHELSVEEALDLRLLAPARVWVAEVDGRGSEVRLLAGDFDEQLLGNVMSEAPFLGSAELFRYHWKNAKIPALICCVSRDQASRLVQYFDERRPPGSQPIGLILGDTPRQDREQILSAFERGEIDTLVQVGVLIEGWNSPRCKLLIDLAPSLSRVRATQKYFRVLTRCENHEARLYVILPAELPALPVLPTELFGPHLRDYECGELIGDDESDGGERKREPAQPLPLESVRVRQRILLEAKFERPRLDRSDLAGIRRVLLSCEPFDPEDPPPIREFCQLFFEHELFVGRGEFLLRWLGLTATTAGYAELLARVLPCHGGAAKLWISDGWTGERDRACQVARQRLKRSLLEQSAQTNRGRDEDFVLAWRAATGGADICDPSWASRGDLTPEAILLRRERLDLATFGLRVLQTTRGRRLLAMAHGLAGLPALPAQLIGFIEGVDLPVVRRILGKSLRDFASGFSADSRAPRHWRASPAPNLCRDKRPLRAWGYSVDPERGVRYATREWAPLTEPLAWGGLLPSVERTVTQLAIPTDWLHEPPAVDRLLLEGTSSRELRWSTDEHELLALAIDGIRDDLGGGEVLVQMLFARLTLEIVVNGDRQLAELCLLGRDGAFQAASIEGQAGRLVARAWETDS